MIDLSDLIDEATELSSNGVEHSEETTEPAVPFKRRRRTKEQMEADRLRAQATLEQHGSVTPPQDDPPHNDSNLSALQAALDANSQAMYDLLEEVRQLREDIASMRDRKDDDGGDEPLSKKS